MEFHLKINLSGNEKIIHPKTDEHENLYNCNSYIVRILSFLMWNKQAENSGSGRANKSEAIQKSEK